MSLSAPAFAGGSLTLAPPGVNSFQKQVDIYVYIYIYLSGHYRLWGRTEWDTTEAT